MWKMPKIGFILVVFLLAISLFTGCAGNKANSGSDSSPASSSASVDMAADAPSPAVDSAKQAAEAAEWEAHRLREELNRKNKSQ